MADISQMQVEAQSARRSALLFSALALVLTAVLVWTLSSVLGKRAGDGIDGKPVVVAARDLAAFTELAPADVTVTTWPATSVPEGAFSRTEDLLQTRRSNLIALYAGEPLVAARVSSVDRGIGVSQLVLPPLRAFVVEVNDSLATSGILQPGVFVDVIGTVKNVRSGDTLSRVVLQNLQVLAIGDRVEPENDDEAAAKDDHAMGERERMTKQRVVTLLVDPEEVEQLALVTREGKIDLALRNTLDKDLIETPGASISKMVGDQAEPPTRSPRVPAAKHAGPAIYRVGRPR